MSKTQDKVLALNVYNDKIKQLHEPDALLRPDRIHSNASTLGTIANSKDSVKCQIWCIYSSFAQFCIGCNGRIHFA
ncbi:hypothetical protein CDL15_Pgr008290 [Punica granatum]|uniref:Uncharacterized protein n=1 Tax=Punica granatum TaxID=22663 RepID=A0A218WRW8_PUNGR|nr:hypothetical protein CDL15_Pgr008290 [Punica granatum]